MRFMSIAGSAVLLGAMAALAHAEEQSDVAACLQAVAPFVEEETVAVAHLNLSRVSPESLDALGRAISLLPGRLPETKEDLAGPLRTLLQAGCKDAYVVVSLNGPDRKWKERVFLILPVPADTKETTIRSILQLSDSKQVRRVAGAIVVELTESKRFAFQPVDRPELKAALEAAGEATARLALIPPAASRRAVEELVPQLPSWLGNGPSRALTRGLIWAAVAADLPPHAIVRLAIQSENASAAEALRVKLADLIKLASQRAEVRAAVPGYDQLAAAFVLQLDGNRLVASWDEKQTAVGRLLVDLVAFAMLDVQRAAASGQSIDNLKYLGLAMWNYWGKHKHFPAPASYTADGKPLLSWRVHILPFVEQEELYKQFHLDEPWDSAHNRALIDKMPLVYRCPMSRNKEKGRTNYLLPVGNGAAFTAGRPTDPIKEITDGTANTIMVLEADDDQAVIWTKPDDWAYDPKNPMKGLGQLYGGRFNTAFCDGSAHVHTRRINPTMLRYMIERADGHAIDASAF